VKSNSSDSVLVLQDFASTLDIGMNLLDKRLDIRKTLFVSQPGDKFQVDLALINISVEIQQMSFNPWNNWQVFERWADPNIRDSTPIFTIHQSTTDIDPGFGYGPFCPYR